MLCKNLTLNANVPSYFVRSKIVKEDHFLETTSTGEPTRTQGILSIWGAPDGCSLAGKLVFGRPAYLFREESTVSNFRTVDCPHFDFDDVTLGATDRAALTESDGEWSEFVCLDAGEELKLVKKNGGTTIAAVAMTLEGPVDLRNAKPGTQLRMYTIKDLKVFLK